VSCLIFFSCNVWFFLTVICFREFGCSLSAQRDIGWEELENDANIRSNEVPLNIQLARFYNYSCTICDHETATFSSFFLLCKHYRCVERKHV
jgi:hypothetical protein